MTLLVIGFIVSCKTEKKEETDNKYSRYDIETGVIFMRSENSGIASKTTMEITFTNFGEKELTKINNTIVGSTMQSTLIKTDSLQYFLMDGQYIKSKRKYEFSLENFDLKRLDEKKVKEYTIKKIGEEEFLEKNCTLYSFENKAMALKGEFYEWRNIPLKIKVERAGMSELMEAYEIVTDTVLAKETFTIPANAKVMDATAIPNN